MRSQVQCVREPVHVCVCVDGFQFANDAQHSSLNEENINNASASISYGP